MASGAAVALTATIARDPLTYPIDFAELFDIDMDELAWTVTLIAAHRLEGLQGREPVQPQALQDPADRCRCPHWAANVARESSLAWRDEKEEYPAGLVVGGEVIVTRRPALNEERLLAVALRADSSRAGNKVARTD